MTLTRRFIYIAALGVFLVAEGFLWDIGLELFIIYNSSCLLLLIVDFFITPGKEAFTVERTGDDKLSIYENEIIEISILNKSDYKFSIEVKDDVPDLYFNVPDGIASKVVMPHTKESFEYIIVPKKRGVYKFNNIYIRYGGRLGLIKKCFHVSFVKEYKVYPNLKALRKYNMPVCRNRQYKNGLKSMRAFGNGTSFESLREYIPGDDYRKINWEATARGDKPIINQYEPERDQHVYAVIDSGRPMSYTVRGLNKLDIAVNTALMLSDIVNRNGDKSGLLAFNTDIQSFIVPGKGAGHRNKMMEALYHIDCTNYTSNYEEAFFYLKRNEKHRSIIFVFTDFDSTEEAEEMLKLLHIISRNNIVIIVLIKNEGLEGIARSKSEDELSMFERAVALELLADRRKIISRLNRLGIMCIECEPENIEINTISKYIQSKSRMHY